MRKRHLAVEPAVGYVLEPVSANAQAELEIAKGEFEKNWLPDEYKESPCKWNLDFATGKLIVEPIGR